MEDGEHFTAQQRQNSNTHLWCTYSQTENWSTSQDCQKLFHAFITSRLDFCNVLFTAFSKWSSQRLQIIQHAAASVLTETKKNTLHLSLNLCSGYQSKQELILKSCCLFTNLNRLVPQYIRDMLITNTPATALSPKWGCVCVCMQFMWFTFVYFTHWEFGLCMKCAL